MPLEDLHPSYPFNPYHFHPQILNKRNTTTGFPSPFPREPQKGAHIQREWENMTTLRRENERERAGGGPCGRQMRAISELVWWRETAAQ